MRIETEKIGRGIKTPTVRVTRAAAVRGGAAALASVVAAACATPGGGGGDGGVPTKPAAPVEIEYWRQLAETHPQEKARHLALELAERANPEQFRVRFEQAGGSNMDKIIAAVSSGTPPNLLVWRPNNAAQLFDVGAAVDVGKELKPVSAWQRARGNLPQGFLDGITWRKALVGMPFQISQQALLYATEHLERAGVRPPTSSWTWNDFLEICKRAARPPDVWGLSIIWRSSGWQLWAGSNGARFLNNEQTKVSYTQPESLAAMEFLSNLTHGLGLIPPNHPQNANGELLAKGQAVFEPQGTGRFPVIRQTGVSFEGILIPRGPHKPTPYNWGSMWSFIVFKSTDPAKQRASALAALACLADEVQVKATDGNLALPVTKSANASTAYQQLLAQDKQWKTFVDMFAYTDILPAIPSYDEMAKIRDEMMTKVYTGKDSIRNALAEAERLTQQLLDADLAKSRG
ncbi:MAG: extracellular solute-binding protein [Chloroflexi bacterium]|nr:extracellular solute-binding protein [Chloroflexota bacterium]